VQRAEFTLTLALSRSRERERNPSVESASSAVKKNEI
jgi:hypothetical protein